MFSSLRRATPWDSSPTSLTNYDVSADGQRFLMVKRESAVAHLSVVLKLVLRAYATGAGKKSVSLTALIQGRSSPS